MSSLLLKNARLLGEKSETSCLIEDGIIKGFNINQTPDKTIDCAGHWLLPSMVDYQSFFNDDLESLETIAIDSGFCEVWAMLPDNRQNKSAGAHLVSPLTRIDENGTERLAEIGLAHKAGKSFFSNGNVAIKDNGLMRQAMIYIADLGGVLVHQPQDPALAAEGLMHEGKISAELGLRGTPPEAETMMLARDLELVRMTGCPYLAQQLSTARGVEMIRAAKKEGLPVACGVSINHLLLNESAIGNFRTFCKLTPPLRSEADRQALLAGVKDGTISQIVSAHNPQSQENKRVPFEHARSGSIGLETFLSAIFLLHHREGIALEVLMKKITPAPHALMAGSCANLVCFEDGAPWTLDVAQRPLASKTQNSALDGTEFTGKIKMTILKGEVKFDARAD